MSRAIVLHPSDNVATVIDATATGTVHLTGLSAREVFVPDPVPFGHKIALQSIEPGGLVIKYGEPIGLATAAIAVGAHVHVQNVESQRGRGDRARETAA